jgi:hypothetical protein
MREKNEGLALIERQNHSTSFSILSPLAGERFFSYRS